MAHYQQYIILKDFGVCVCVCVCVCIACPLWILCYSTKSSFIFTVRNLGLGPVQRELLACLWYCCSVTKLCWTLWYPIDCSVARLLCPHYVPRLLKFMSIELVMIINHLILCCPLLALSSILPRKRVFSKETCFLIRWSKFLSFSFNNSPFNEYSGLISFRID